MYSNTHPPSEAERIPGYLANETQRLEDELRNHEADSIILTKHHVLPKHGAEGQIKYFAATVVGVTELEGLYQYRTGVWVFIA